MPHETGHINVRRVGTEYCVYRGIVDHNFASHVGLETTPEATVIKQADGVSCSVENYPEVCKKSDGSTLINCSSMYVKQNADVESTQRTDIELRCSSESSNAQDDCSISGTTTCSSLKIGHKNRIHRAEDRSRRKRWRGRQDLEDLIPDSLCKGNLKPCRATNLNSGEPKGSEKYEIVLGMKELASKGMACEVMEEINSIDPEFFAHHASLLFQLKQVEFLKLVKLGDHSGALRIAHSHLGPLAANNPDLLNPLKETLLAFLRPNGDALNEGLPLHAIATSLQVALGRRFGIEEPQLMKIMKATLHTHTEWFKLQMCKYRFEGFLKIDCLKDVDTLLLTSAVKSNVDSFTLDSSQATVSSGSIMGEDNNSPQMSSRDCIYDENAILKVMVLKSFCSSTLEIGSGLEILV